MRYDASSDPPRSGAAAVDVDHYVHGQVPRPVREQQLLGIAEELFVERGFTGTAIGEVARRAGVSRPIVYGHFGSKEGLFLAVLRRIRSELEEEFVAAGASHDDPYTRLERAADAFFRILARDPARWALVYGGASQLVGPLADQLAVEREHTVERIADLFALSAPGADPERLLAFAHAASGTGEQLGRHWLRHQEIPLERILDHFLAFCWPPLAALIETTAHA